MGESKKTPKLPVQQILILAICRFAEPLTLTSVFPYLPEMIESFHVPEKEVASWAGISSAVFAISQAVAGVFWGRASDRWGRKYVVLFDLSFSFFATLVFGFSKSLMLMITARVLAGLSGGGVGIIRTTVAELVPQKELQPRAFSIMPLIYTIGGIFGPAIGGILANPAKTYPEIFGKSNFFKIYPYALPNLALGFFFLIGIVTGFLFLNETLEEKKHDRDYGRIIGRRIGRAFQRLFGKPKPKTADDETTPLLKDHTDAPASQEYNPTNHHHNTIGRPRATYREVFSRQSSIVLISFGLLCLHSVAYNQLLAIFMHTPQQNDRSSDPNVQLPFKFAGGFGLESQRIGVIFTGNGIAIIFLQLFVFPTMAHRLGVLPCSKLSSVIHPIYYILTPFTALLPTPASQQIAIFLVLLLRGCAIMLAFPCNAIMLTNSAASPHLLGVLNGVGTTFSAIGSAIGPAVVGYMFSLGMKTGYGLLPWLTLAFFAILGAVPIWCLEDTERASEKIDPEEPVAVAGAAAVDAHHPLTSAPVSSQPPLDIEQLGAARGDIDRLVGHA